MSETDNMSGNAPCIWVLFLTGLKCWNSWLFLCWKELLQSEKVIQVLRDHQQKVKQDKIKEIQERKIKKEQEPKETAGTQGNHAGSA